MTTVTTRQKARLKELFRDRLDQGAEWEKCREYVVETAEDMLGMPSHQAEQLVKELSHEVLTEMARFYEVDAAVLVDSEWSPWYTGPREEDGCWPAYKSRLVDDKKWDREAVDSIDRSSSAVLARMKPPIRGSQPCRGLVVGHIQSGKTSNLTAVIAKAVDRGYRLVIVLTGLTDALREQTQKRLEDDLVKKSQEYWDPLTEVGSDFDVGGRKKLIVPKNAAYLAVVKKNTHVLAKLREVLTNTSTAARASLPALVIDDETDQASPDVSKQDKSTDPSTINKRIREILKRLDFYSYVGYTATPFANVLINPAGGFGDEDIEADIYPRDFIVSLPKPNGYFGTEDLFGRDLISADDPGPDNTGFNMIETLSAEDVEAVRALEASDGAANLSIPTSLENAILWFALSAGVRAIRSDLGHCTMMVHTSMFTLAHSGIAAGIRQGVTALVERPPSEIDSRMKELWERGKSKVNPQYFGYESHDFEELREGATNILRKLEVYEDNYIADQTVNFEEEEPTLYAIIIGGNRLSRGLTLPGLLVSYFARKSQQYDTLLQMGRWFGYRAGYEDLPRVWMTAEAAAAFRELATIEAEIREDIAVYADGGMRPVDWGIRIRQVPGMLVTRRAAMQSAIQCNLTYSGEHLQTIRFRHRDKQWLTRNWAAGSRLVDSSISNAFERSSSNGAEAFFGVPVDNILAFFQDYQTVEQKRTDTNALCRYIRKYADDELSLWNVAVAVTREGTASEQHLGQLGPVRMVVRSRLEDSNEVADIKALMSKSDVFLDVQRRPENSAQEGWKKLKLIRRGIQGNSHRPLLILYPIDRASEPKYPGKARVPLDAVMDVLGIGIVFPEDPIGYQGHYVTVDLSQVRGDEGDGS